MLPLVSPGLRIICICIVFVFVTSSDPQLTQNNQNNFIELYRNVTSSGPRAPPRQLFSGEGDLGHLLMMIYTITYFGQCVDKKNWQLLITLGYFTSKGDIMTFPQFVMMRRQKSETHQ